MSLDIYVMPLWRFKVGDYRSPIEAAIGRRPKIITGHGAAPQPIAAGWVERWRARRKVTAVRKTVERENGVRLRWNDEGDVVFAQQGYGLLSLQVFAMWLHRRDRFPVFEPPANGDYVKHPVVKADLGRLSCPHLVRHDLTSGYYLLCEFEKITQVEPYMIFGRWPAIRPVGSSPRLLRELDFVQKELQAPADYKYSADDPRASVKQAYLQLRQAATLSCEHELPIVFCG